MSDSAKKVVMAAVHAQKGEEHVVALGPLLVLLSKDEDGWFAQGLQIDCIATGDSVDAVKKNFQDGLCATVHEHLRLNGGIEKLVDPAPKEVWEEFFTSSKGAISAQVSTVQMHKMSETADAEGELSIELPFEQIQFVERALQAA